jgi:VanZ family protein
MRNSKISCRLLFVLSAVLLLIVLFFGLSSKDFHFSNDATWIQHEPGLRFENYGIAYATIDDQTKSTIAAAKAFSIEIAFKPKSFDVRRFSFLLSIHAGKDSDQLIIEQWQSSMIIMNGNDYRNRRKTKRIATDIVSSSPQRVLLTITTGAEGTALYVNGRLIRKRAGLILKIPKGDVQRLVLGNSVYGQNSWKGELYGLAIYFTKLDAETVESRFHAWSKNQALPFSSTIKPALFFALDEGKGTETSDHVNRSRKLNIPADFPVLNKKFITPPWRDFSADINYLTDVMINLLGFLPLGFILCALFILSDAVMQKKAIVLSVIVCFFISLGIEIAQAWIPSRSSQGSDLLMNTIGAFIGAILCKPLLRARLNRKTDNRSNARSGL